MGRAGRTAIRWGKQGRRQFLERNRGLIALLITGYLAVASFVLVVPVPWPRSFSLGCLVVGLAWLLSSLLAEDPSHHKFRGAEAERWTASVLRKLRRQGWRSIDCIPFDSYDVDHVAFGGGGVYAVETKRTSVPWTISEEGIAGPKWDPLDQAIRGARSVRLLLRSFGIDVDVRPALILWGAGAPATDGGRIVRGVKVLSGRESRTWIDALPPVGVPLPATTVDAIERALREFVDRREEYERGSKGRRSRAIA